MRKTVTATILIFLLVFAFGFTQRFSQPISESDDIDNLYNDGQIDEETYNNLIYFYENNLDPNNATISDLEALPAIEPLDARNIVQYRERVGQYKEIKDLLKVPGMDESKLEQIRAFVSFAEAVKRKIPIRGEYKLNVKDSQKRVTSYTSTEQKKTEIDNIPSIDQYLRIYFSERMALGLNMRGRYYYDDINIWNSRPEIFDKQYELNLLNKYLRISNNRSRLFSKIIVGDYSARYGQINVGRALKVGSLTRMRNTSKTRFRGNISSSSAENGFAVLSRWGYNLSTVFMYSDKNEDGRYKSSDNPILNRSIFTLDSSEKLPGLINSKKVGLNLNYGKENWYTDANIWYYRFRKNYDMDVYDFPSSNNVATMSLFGGWSGDNSVTYLSYVRKFHSKTDALGLKSQLKMGSLRYEFKINYKDADRDVDESKGEFGVYSAMNYKMRTGRIKWRFDFDYDRIKETDMIFFNQETLLNYAAKEVGIDTSTVIAISKGNILRTSEAYTARLEGRVTRNLTLILQQSWSDNDVASDKGNNRYTTMEARFKPFSKAYIYLKEKLSQNDIKYPSKYKKKMETSMTFRYNVTKPMQLYFRYRLKDNNLDQTFDETLDYTMQMTYKFARSFYWRVKYAVTEYHDANTESYSMQLTKKW